MFERMPTQAEVKALVDEALTRSVAELSAATGRPFTPDTKTQLFAEVTALAALENLILMLVTELTKGTKR